MGATMALAGGVLSSVWWLSRGARRARRLYRRWRYRNSIFVYGFREPGRAWPLDAALTSVLALAGPLLSDDLDATRCWRGLLRFALVVWLAAGAPPLDEVWR